MLRRFFKQIVFAVVVLWAFTTTAAGQQYRIATVAWIGWSPLHVAQEKGFWKALGLDVAVVTYDDPIVILEAIKAGKIDLAMDMAGSLVGIYMEGEPIKAIAETNWSHGGDKIIIHQGKRVNQYVGGLIGVFLNQPSCLYFVDRYLQDANLTISDYRIIEVNPRDLTAQFIADRIPIIVNYEPWANEAVIRGNGEILATSADYTGCIPECMWGYKKQISSMPEEDIRNILKGWVKAIRWMKIPANRDEYYRILKETTFKSEPELTTADFTRMLNAVLIHDTAGLIEQNQDAGGMIRYLENLHSFLARNGRLTREFTPAGIFDNRYILEVLKNEINE